ncbi:MAG TPA: nucleotidyltransferase [Alcaligenes phenolicus]|uniref:nucleotidyltransferase domain-containing protein n=2 Tax=Alcaligenes phenolicus TaxID=232846 RepID=UPI002B5F59D0|nr:nucleotidyltransferase [Alcaligenes phenolicus]HRO19034.1 nucleotidyltransferase [Alcaligenes phenolicus]HRP14871.1 nucleotidyltransferase [Alcaligenes phenolicus]
MVMTKNAEYVEGAIQRLGGFEVLAKILNPTMGGPAVARSDTSDSAGLLVNVKKKREPYAHALSLVNDHITVNEDVIEDARAAYTEIATLLAEKLKVRQQDITIFPQGSASTRTLIRTVGSRNFDIDAVCVVDISAGEANDPMAFFEAVGAALEGKNPERKRRCWTINFAGKPYYIEFTPSIPLTTAPLTAKQQSSLERNEHQFLETALAVVDTPSQSWKTSNPAGIRDWVNRAAERNIVVQELVKSCESLEARIEPVGAQSVEVEETLRVAIRLFKRHRDMCVHRGHLESEYQPISIILVTLLTTCYEGLADLLQQRVIPPFPHAVDALIAIANLLPEMLPKYPDGQYYLDNPTVVDENFAERWNADQGQRAEAFRKWCAILRDDLQKIVAQTTPEKITETTLEVFGCTNAQRPTGGNGAGNLGLNTIPPSPKAAPRTSGLA